MPISRHLFSALLPTTLMATGAAAAPPDADVLRLLEEAPLVDGHNDLPWQLRDRFDGRLDRVDLADTTGVEGGPIHTDLERLKAGRVGGVFWAAFVPVELEPEAALKATIEQVDLIHRMAAAHPESLTLATTADEVVAAHRAGRIASLIGVEGAHSLAGSPAALRTFRALGARYLTLTHWTANPFADAATAPPKHGGLSPAGRALVRELERLGMLVDLSHVSDAVMNDVLDQARGPVLFSHSSARALCDHPRNVPDDVLRRVKANEGLVMVNFATFFISQPFQDWYADLQAERGRLEARFPADGEAQLDARVEAWMAEHPPPTAPLSLLADHVQHVREVAGVDHVGLGSDFDGVLALPEGMGDVSGFPRLLTELKRRGWSREDLAKLAGGNLLRVLRASEDLAERLVDEAPWDGSAGSTPDPQL